MLIKLTALAPWLKYRDGARGLEIGREPIDVPADECRRLGETFPGCFETNDDEIRDDLPVPPELEAAPIDRSKVFATLNGMSAKAAALWIQLGSADGHLIEIIDPKWGDGRVTVTRAARKRIDNLYDPEE